MARWPARPLHNFFIFFHYLYVYIIMYIYIYTYLEQLKPGKQKGALSPAGSLLVEPAGLAILFKTTRQKQPSAAIQRQPTILF